MNSSEQKHPDDQWLEQLTGVDNKTAAEESNMLKSLRSSVLESHRSELMALGEIDDLALKSLLQRCRDEKLIEQDRPWWKNIGWMPAVVAVATVCLLLIVSVNMGERQGSIDKVYRGLVDKKVIVKIVTEPMQRAAALQLELQQAGASQVLMYQMDESWIITANIGEPVQATIAAVLTKYQLRRIEKGMLKVNFVAEHL